MIFPVLFGEKRMPYPPGAFEGNGRIAVSETDGDLCDFTGISATPWTGGAKPRIIPTAPPRLRPGWNLFSRPGTPLTGGWKIPVTGNGPTPAGETMRHPGPDQDRLWPSVEIDCAEIMIRADFPRANYWTQAVLTFSDGSRERLTRKKQRKAGDLPSRRGRFPG